MALGIRIIWDIIVLFLMLLPALVLIVASIRWLRAKPHFSTIMMAIGSILAAVASASFIAYFFAGLLFSHDYISENLQYINFMFQGINYVALLLIGVGSFFTAGRLKS